MAKTIKYKLLKDQGKTQIELQREKIKEGEESIEHMRQVDLPESQGGGRTFIAQIEKEKLKEEAKVKADILTDLQKKQKQQFGYRRSLAEASQQSIDQLDIPVGWMIQAVPTSVGEIRIKGKGFKTQEGILFIAQDPQGNVHARAIKTTMDPQMDLHACMVMIEQVENTLDHAKGLLYEKTPEGKLKKTKSGIYLGNVGHGNDKIIS